MLANIEFKFTTVKRHMEVLSHIMSQLLCASLVGGGGGCQLIVAETKAGEQLETYHKLGYPPVEAGGKGTFTPKTTARNLMKDLPSSRMIHGKG